MIKKILIVCSILTIILFTTACNNNCTQEDMEACRDITVDLLTLSYDFYNDYSKLPEHYKSIISSEEYKHISIRVDKEYEDLGELGKDYYESYYINKPKISIWKNKVCVSFTYEYSCYSYVGGSILYYDGCDEDCPSEIYFEKVNGEYKVVKAMNYISPSAREYILEEMENE